MSIQASNLIRFTPGPHAPGDSEPVERFTLILSTLLNGQLRTVTTTGNPLAVTLTIAFTEAVLSWCERVRLIGVSPPGHAPLEIEHPSAWGEPCAYLGPEDDQPLFWRLDREYENDEDRGPSVEISWPIDINPLIWIWLWKPRDNIYPFFDWPAPVIGFDPPLKPGETPGPQPSADIKAIIDAHNAIRRSLGITEDLVFNPRLSGTVERHLNWLLETYPQYLDGSQPPPDWDPHEGDPDGRLSPGARAWADGYPSEPGSSVGENLAFHQRTVEELMTSWVNSPPHYANLIDPKWRTMGAAFVPNPSNPSNPDAHLCGALFGEIVEDPLDAVTMELEALKNLRPPTGEGETEIGVQLPMRLIAIKDGQTGETEIAVYNYEKAPGFTGSGDRVTFKHSDEVDPQPPNGAVFYLDERTLIERLTDGNAGNDPEPGLYELWWRIYHGSGDMIYRLSCQGSQTDATYRDRRSGGIGGGFGTFLTSDCLAAKVRLDPEPYPFVCLSGGNRYNVSAEGDYRALPAETLTGERSWIGPEGEIVTWSDTSGVPISIGGRNIRARQIVATEYGRALETEQYPWLFSCLAVCLWRDADGLLWLRAAQAIFTGSAITGVRLREMALQVNRQWVTRNTVAAPFIQHTPTLRARPSRASFSWSQDGTRLCCWAAPVLRTESYAVSGSTFWKGVGYPGSVWESEIEINEDGNVTLTPFIENYRDTEPVLDLRSTSMRADSGGTNAYDVVLSGVAWANYAENELRVHVLAINCINSAIYTWFQQSPTEYGFHLKTDILMLFTLKANDLAIFENQPLYSLDYKNYGASDYHYIAVFHRWKILPEENMPMLYAGVRTRTTANSANDAESGDAVLYDANGSACFSFPLNSDTMKTVPYVGVSQPPDGPSIDEIGNAATYAVVRAWDHLRDVTSFRISSAIDLDGNILAQFQVKTDPSIRACTGTLAPEIADVHLDAIHLLGKGVCMAPIPRETP